MWSIYNLDYIDITQDADQFNFNLSISIQFQPKAPPTIAFITNWSALICGESQCSQVESCNLIGPLVLHNQQ